MERELAQLYGVDAVTTNLIRRGQGGAEVYEATLDGSRKALRLSGPWLSARPEWVEFEGELLRRAAKRGVAVASAVPGVDGRYGQPIGYRLAFLTDWAEGNVEWPTPDEKARALGAEVARLHQATVGMATPEGMRSFGTDGILTRPLALLNEVADTASLRDGVEEMRERVERISRSPETFGPIHGDVHQGNCHFHEGRVTLFDFAQCGVGWRAFDLAGFLWPWRDSTILKPSIRAACDGYLEGYRSERPLSQEEERALPAFVRARDLWGACEWIATGDGRDKPADVHGAIRYWSEQWAANPLPDQF